MNEKKPTPFERMAAILAEMTERAVEAERQRDAAKEDADNWYKLFCDREGKLNEVKAELEAQTKENDELRSSLTAYIETMEKGESGNE